MSRKRGTSTDIGNRFEVFIGVLDRESYTISSFQVEIDKTDPSYKLEHKMNLVSNYFTK
jgi:hypothetical protein